MTDIGINRHGQVVGSAHFGSGSSQQAFFWEHGVLTELDGSVAFDINDKGDIVGINSDGQGVVWTRRGR
jgi:probable HAF family extracellular repeat protein